MELILNDPMIGHVFRNVAKSSLLTDVVVATCDQIIFDYIKSIGGEACMTSHLHERASDRCAEALLNIENERGFKYDIVVMVQGDEPMTNSIMIQEALAPMILNQEIKVVNLMSQIKTDEEFADRNCIKVVFNLNNEALYFSREPIPTKARGQSTLLYKQVCVIPFRRDYLLEYTTHNQTPLEIAESVDMLRVLEMGEKVAMVITNQITGSVDTPNDLLRIERLMAGQMN
jgi:3-deoxy-manno-octulosonate cytidylyltransferase (CMP-KDO synthetase)